MHDRPSGTRGRLTSLACALALVTVLVPPSLAAAHSSCAPVVQGVMGTFAQAVNVFDAVIDTKLEECEEQFAQVQPVMGREYAPEALERSGAPAAAGVDEPESYAQCRDGRIADTYDCEGITMLSHVTMEELGATFVNDIWGWTDPTTNVDYAIVGSSTGTTFVDISRPKFPVVKGTLPTASTRGSSSWRDMKVFDDHAFIVSEHSNHGVQVFDLTRLRADNDGPVTYDADARYAGVGSVHNIALNTDTGFAYAVGSSREQTTGDCGSGLHMIDVNDPKNPAFAGCWDGDGYVHDTQCITYDGPDSDYAGREICFNATPNAANGGGLEPSVSVVDVTDKANPVGLANVSYDIGDAQTGYSHQGWLSEDRTTYFHGDELEEESSANPRTTTRVWDMTDLDDPKLTETFRNDTTAIDHNMYVDGDLMFQSNYTTGLRVLDVSNAADGNIEEVGFFDMYPENDNATFEGGSWSNYPYFSYPNVVAVSSIDRGLFIVRTTNND